MEKITIENLKKLNLCKSEYKSKNSLLDAWNTCERGDWMLELAQKLGCPLQLLTLAKGRCAETVLHLMRDDRSRKAVEVAIDFGNGIATHEELDAAADAAHVAAKDAFDYAFAAYAAAASNAAFAAYAAANADVADAADAAADAAAADYTDAYAADPAATDYAEDEAYAAADAAKKANQLQTANICREILGDFIKSVLTNKIEG